MAACTVDGCDRPTKARSLCSTHYKRWWKTATVEDVDEIDHLPPIPAGLLDAVTARLDAVHDGLDAEHEASTKLRELIDNLH